VLVCEAEQGVPRLLQGVRGRVRVRARARARVSARVRVR